MTGSRLLIAAVAIVAALPAAAKITSVKVLETWTGQMPATVGPLFQTSLASAEDLQRVWTTCQMKGAPPKIDFQKHVVLLAVRRSGAVRFVDLKLDDGNLKTNVVVTPDVPPHQTCKLVLVERAGVTSVNGVPLGK